MFFLRKQLLRYFPKRFFQLRKKMSEDDQMPTLMELGDANIQFLPDESKPLKYLVFKIVNCFGDDSIALSNIHVMFRGEATQMVDILNIYLGMKEGNDIVRIGTAVPDDDDLRVCPVVDWNHSVPLPLGNNLLEKLRIVIHIDAHVDPSRVKFGADVIEFPEVFLKGNPKMKRKLGTSVIKFQGGTLIQVESPVSALQLENEKREVENSKVVTITPEMKQQLQHNLALQNIIVSLMKADPVEHWWDQNFVSREPKKTIKSI